MTGLKESGVMIDEIVQAIYDVVGPAPVALHEPSFEGNEWRYLKECLDTNYVSSVGKFVEQFEAQLTSFTDAKFAIPVVNGTAALHIALKLVGVTEGDEVLIPSLTFVATANAISYSGATPHLVDSEKETLGIDVGKLREYLEVSTEILSGRCINKLTRKVIRAIVPMHTFGHPSDIEGLLSIANDFHIAIVEDAAEALGSFYKEKHLGTFGLLGILSFNGNKTITTGGGGAILTNSEVLASRAKHLITTAKVAHDWEFDHSEVGYNYRMPNINAALGCAQMEQLTEKLRLKRHLFSRYAEAFAPVHGVVLFKEPKNCHSNYWLQTLLLDEDKTEWRDTILKKTHRMRIMTRPAWKLMNTLAPYRDVPAMNLDTAISLYRRIISLPSSPQLCAGVK
jgi:perosamine synthetase